MSLNRRQFLFAAASASALAAAPNVLLPAAAASAAGATLLTGAGYAAKFTRALPRQARIDLTGTTTSATITARQAAKQILTGYPATNLYTYNGGATGPTILARKNRTTHVTWKNGLPTGTTTLANGGHLLPVDASLLEADMLALAAGQKPFVTHLHGSHVDWHSDGYPEAWVTQNGSKGSAWSQYRYTYTNDQRSSTLWYHDHSMGITRLNNYAGLQGMVLLRDALESSLVARHVLPDFRYEQELHLQDKSFTDDGQLFLPTDTTNGGITFSVYLDFMLVNGAPWPVMKVEPRKYRFRVLNGSDSRILVLGLDNGQSFLVVGSDQGLLPAAVSVSSLVMAPGERYDIVIDFSKAAGSSITVLNTGIDSALIGFMDATGTPTNRPTDTPYGFGAAADPNSTGQVMRFTVGSSRSSIKDASVTAGTTLLGTLPALTPTNTRGVMTYQGTDSLGRSMEMLGSLTGGTAMWMDPVSEVVQKGTTEIWEIYNTGPVAHPIHIHLVDFQVLDRAPFTFTTEPMAMNDGSTGAMLTVTGTGTARGPEAYETGRKDTVICYPGEVTRVAATFDLAGNYVWHCHILHHEDHGMMRPVTVA